VPVVAVIDAIEAGPVNVGRSERGVTINHGRRPSRTWDALDLEQAQELVSVLDRARADDAPCKLVGSVTMTNGRAIYVIRWPAAVSLRVRADEHSGVTMNTDQVQALRDALDRVSR
jgi:hypothetical protein